VFSSNAQRSQNLKVALLESRGDTFYVVKQFPLLHLCFDLCKPKLFEKLTYQSTTSQNFSFFLYYCPPNFIYQSWTSHLKLTLDLLVLKPLPNLHLFSNLGELCLLRNLTCWSTTSRKFNSFRTKVGKPNSNHDLMPHPTKGPLLVQWWGVCHV